MSVSVNYLATLNTHAIKTGTINASFSLKSISKMSFCKDTLSSL